MTRSIERLARFLAVSRRHLIEGVMPSRRLPRRAAAEQDGPLSDAVVAELDGWSRAAAWPRLARVSPAGATAGGAPADRAVRHSNEKRPSATSLASG